MLKRKGLSAPLPRLMRSMEMFSALGLMIRTERVLLPTVLKTVSK